MVRKGKGDFLERCLNYTKCGRNIGEKSGRKIGKKEGKYGGKESEMMQSNGNDLEKTNEEC